jgi:hypothetical protein
MINNYKIIVDNQCLNHPGIDIADEVFLDLKDSPIDDTAIYIIGFNQFMKYDKYICDLICDHVRIIVFNPLEGSQNMIWMYETYGFRDLIKNYSLGVVVGGDQPADMPALYFEFFLPVVLDHKENLIEMEKIDQIYLKSNKPYKFLFLNGRDRPHRKYLIYHLKQKNLLEDSLWTNLDPKESMCHPFPQPMVDNRSIGSFSTPVKFLPVEYEVNKFQEQLAKGVVANDIQANKSHLFKDQWGDVYFNAKSYIDTYFSLVTETIFDCPYSFRTEKIWKPIAMGHPFIVASNPGYLRDLKQLGFRTFDHLIDESYDSIIDRQKRIDRIIGLVDDLCQRDLPAFLAAAEDVCKYNQQHLVELASKIRAEFPKRFEQFINERFKI